MIMRTPRFAFHANATTLALKLIALTVLLSPLALTAQTNCEEGDGPLNSAPPQGISVPDLIQKFAEKEAIFKEARNHYTYTQEVSVETLDGDTVDGQFKETTDVLYDDQGKRIENVTYAPMNTLTRVTLTKEDYDDFRNHLPFVLTTEDLPEYNILYAGQQHVDELDTYVFDVAPKKVEKKEGGPRFFQGRIWVDNRDFQIVKTCGKNVPDIHKKDSENLSPKFVTYREQVDGQYWFPTYTRADDFLHFKSGDVHIRETLKYTNYKRFGVKTRIIYNGQPIKNGSEPK
jgi:outer membrane lipoprotein-sorting protein